MIFLTIKAADQIWKNLWSNRVTVIFIQLFADEAVRMPTVYDWLPHLVNVHRQSGLQPVVHIASGHRRNYDYVIGVPTVPRERVRFVNTLFGL